MRKAVGIHVFAGSFTYGVKRVFDVQCQLETHNYGRETCEQVFDTPFINEPDANWPDVEAEFAYGNPRCTGFSCITSGYSKETHGPWSKQTVDIHQLCKYAAGRFDIIVWESVQQAFSTGRPLLDYLRDEVFLPKHYRIAHVLVNAASFGNSQQRRRYFFIAYRDDRNFNVVPPNISKYYNVLYDAIWDLKDRDTHEQVGHEYDFDTYVRLTADEKSILPHMPNGWCLNTMGRHAFELLTPKLQQTWLLRSSEMPFSMHCIFRSNWLRPSPTLHSSSCRIIHPWHNRPLTVGELSAIMGWDGKIPVGKGPAALIAKGVCPCAGEWIAKQASLYLDNAWGDEDWESSYDSTRCEWVGRDTNGAPEKVFNLTKYVGQELEFNRYDERTHIQRHRYNVDECSGKLAKPWAEVTEQKRGLDGAAGLSSPLE